MNEFNEQLTFDQINDRERYGDSNEVNYPLLFEDLRLGRIIIPKTDNKRHKLKYPLCECGHPKSQHIAYNKPNVNHRCQWFNCPCQNYKPKEIIDKEERK